MNYTKSSHSPHDKKRLELMLKALSNPIRFRIIEMLSSRRVCITNDIVASTNLAQSTVSQHLKELLTAGLVQFEIFGPSTRYSIDPEGICWFKEQVKHWMPEFSPPED